MRRLRVGRPYPTAGSTEEPTKTAPRSPVAEGAAGPRFEETKTAPIPPEGKMTAAPTLASAAETDEAEDAGAVTVTKTVLAPSSVLGAFACFLVFVDAEVSEAEEGSREEEVKTPSRAVMLA